MHSNSNKLHDFRDPSPSIIAAREQIGLLQDSDSVGNGVIDQR